LREVAAPSRKVEDAVSATRTLLRMNSTISWRTWRASMGSRRFPYDPIDGIHRSLWNGSRIGIGSCRRPLWMILMSSSHSKRTTAGIANRFPRSRGPSPAAIRARAILLLVAVYGAKW
jgi:hypothetical protein